MFNILWAAVEQGLNFNVTVMSDFVSAVQIILSIGLL